MGYYKQLDIELRNQSGANEELDLADIAAKLGGELDGEWVRIPSPGEGSDDRSCFVKFSSASKFFVYECSGKKGRAYAAIKKKLGIAEAPRPDNNQAIERILKETHVGRGTKVEHYLRARNYNPGPVLPQLSSATASYSIRKILPGHGCRAA
jgi:hypothetical protein